MDKHLKKMAIELRDEFNEAADQLDKHTKNVNIARVTGGSAAVAGGVMAIIGFVMAPLTLGISAGVAAVAGTALAGAGGLTAGGASVTKGFIEQNKLQALAIKWSCFIKKLKKKLYEFKPEIIQEVNNELERAKAATEKTADVSLSILKEAMKVAGRGRRAGRAAAISWKGEGAAARSDTGTEPILQNIGLICVSLIDIIEGSIQLHMKTGSKAGNYLRELAQSLDDFVRDD